MDRLQQIKTKIERAKTYGLEPTITLADIEWLIERIEWGYYHCFHPECEFCTSKGGE